jgi:hypothetical protein
MRATSRPRKRWLATALAVIATLAGALGFFSEATYSVALVGSYYWLGTGILAAILALAVLVADS